VLEQADGAVLRTIGRYVDTYGRRDGQWRFVRRSFSMLKGH
jgi:hypothetical protein